MTHKLFVGFVLAGSPEVLVMAAEIPCLSFTALKCVYRNLIALEAALRLSFSKLNLKSIATVFLCTKLLSYDDRRPPKIFQKAIYFLPRTIIARYLSPDQRKTFFILNPVYYYGWTQLIKVVVSRLWVRWRRNFDYFN